MKNKIEQTLERVEKQRIFNSSFVAVLENKVLIKIFSMYKSLSWNLKEEELNSRSPKNF